MFLYNYTYVATHAKFKCKVHLCKGVVQIVCIRLGHLPAHRSGKAYLYHLKSQLTDFLVGKIIFTVLSILLMTSLNLKNHRNFIKSLN